MNNNEPSDEMILLQKTYFGIVCVLLSGLFFGLIGFFGINVIHAHISVYNMLFWRFTVSWVFIGFLLIFFQKKINGSRIEVLKVILYGIFFYGPCSVLYFYAATHIGSGLAMVIFFTYPAWVMLLDQLIYKSPINLIYCSSLITIFIGMCFLANDYQVAYNIQGILFSILSALCYALYILLSKKSLISPLPSTFMISLGSMICCFIAATDEHSFLIPNTLLIWLNIFGIGIICTALPILLLLKGLNYLSSTQASLLSVLEPVFVVIFGVLLLGEQLSFIQSVGIVVIIVGSILSLFNSSIRM